MKACQFDSPNHVVRELISLFLQMKTIRQTIIEPVWSRVQRKWVEAAWKLGTSNQGCPPVRVQHLQCYVSMFITLSSRDTVPQPPPEFSPEREASLGPFPGLTEDFHSTFVFKYLENFEQHIQITETWAFRPGMTSKMTVLRGCLKFLQPFSATKL